MTVYKITLSQSKPQKFSVNINGAMYYFTLTWIETAHGGWNLDIYDANNKLLLGGLFLNVGVSLLRSFPEIFPFDLALIGTTGYNAAQGEIGLTHNIYVAY